MTKGDTKIRMAQKAYTLILITAEISGHIGISTIAKGLDIE
ncbi:hypothetical protein JCM17961_50640 [Endothiovibrio diazotrophicus]